MSNVYTSILGVPKRYRNGRIYGVGSSFSSTTVQSEVGKSVVAPTDVIEFENAIKPTISEYNTLWAPTHSQYPNVRLFIIIDANSIFECRKVDPIFTYIDGLIDTISFDYGDPNVACFIVLN